MHSLGVHDVGLPTDTSRALHSMLQVLQGRMRTPWQTRTLERADLLLAHSDCDAGVLAAWHRTGKPVVLVIDERAPRPTVAFVLRQPIRVMQLMTVLEAIAEQIHSTLRPRDGGEADATWGSLETLRQLMARGDSGQMESCTNDGSRLWIDRSRAFVGAATLQQLRLGRAGAGPFIASTQPVPETTIGIATTDLAWMLALGGPAELAPWLSPDASYRLRRWPDFGRLGTTTALIELAAVASARAWTPARLAEASGKDSADIFRFLNAASMAGLLASTPAPARTGTGVACTRLWSRLVGDLRRHLGFTP